SCNRDFGGGAIIYPQLEPDQKIETYFGHRVTDDYSQLSDFQEPLVQDWFKAQDSLAESYFMNNTLYDQLLNRFHNLENRATGDISLVNINEKGNYFYLRYDDSLGVDRLFYRKSILAEESELFNPALFPE